MIHRIKLANPPQKQNTGVCLIQPLNWYLVWTHGLFEDLQVNIQLSITLYRDNSYAEQLAHNPMFYEKTKHLEKRICIM